MLHTHTSFRTDVISKFSNKETAPIHKSLSYEGRCLTLNKSLETESNSQKLVIWISAIPVISTMYYRQIPLNKAEREPKLSFICKEGNSKWIQGWKKKSQWGCSKNEIIY